MNRTITVLNGQTLFDIAIQHCGDVVATFEIADINDVSLTDRLIAGQSLTVPQPYNRAIVDFYNKNKIIPATEEA